MKIITTKQAKKIAQGMKNNFATLLKQHGIKPKEKALLQFENEMLKALGGKK